MTSPLRSIMNIKRSEIPFAFIMFAYFFAVIAAFWILKPLKKGLFIEYYDAEGLQILGWHLRASQAELLAKVMNMVVAFFAMAVFSSLSSRFRRQKLTLVFVVFLQLCHVAFALILRDPTGPVVWAFYLFGDLFNMLMVASFFAFLNDSVRPEQAKRLYGLIVLGGVLGGVFGATVVRAWIGLLTPDLWMLVVFAGGMVIGALALAAGIIVDKRSAGFGTWKREEIEEEGLGAMEGIRLVFQSRYLLSIAALVGVYEVVSVLVDFQFTETVSSHLNGPSISEFFSTVYLITNFVSMGVQLLLTGFVMSRFGLVKALLVLPVALLLASAGFLAVPILLTGGILSVADNGLNYSINQSARETLYVPTGAAQKYRAKAFIDIFGQRFAKTVGIFLVMGLSMLLHVRWLSLVTVVLLVLWVGIARYAGKRFDDKGTKEKEEGRQGS